MTNPFSINVEAAVNHKNKWLLCKRSLKEEHAAGVLSLVGGTIEHTDASNDTLEYGLIREIAEEIGVTISVDKYVQSTSFITNKGNHVVDIVFLCSIVEGIPVAINPDEIESLHWMTIDEIKNDPNSPSWLVASIERANSVMGTISSDTTIPEKLI